MKLVTAPETSALEGKSLFIAGGITGCSDWQQELIEMLSEEDVTLLNPRQESFDVSNPSAAPAQIVWEHSMLRAADAISFWFAPETVQPITLYELGAWSMSDKPLFIGVDPRYGRALDVEWQTRLTRPDLLPVSPTLPRLATKIKIWIGS